MKKGDIVKDTSRNHYGKITKITGEGAYVFNTSTGQNGFFLLKDLEPATQDAYDQATETRLHPPKQTLFEAKPASTKATLKTFRWLCLECGAKYNGRSCPQCDGDDRILNLE